MYYFNNNLASSSSKIIINILIFNFRYEVLSITYYVLEVLLSRYYLVFILYDIDLANRKTTKETNESKSN